MILYHVTTEGMVPAIQRKGIVPASSGNRMWNMQSGVGRESGYVYAFTDLDDAVRWAAKTEYDCKVAAVLVQFKDDEWWETDDNIQMRLSYQSAVRKKGVVAPEQVIYYLPLTQDLVRGTLERWRSQY